MQALEVAMELWANIETTATVNITIDTSKHMATHESDTKCVQALGVAVELSPASVSACIEQTRLGFMYAPYYHPVMKSVKSVRSALQVRSSTMVRVQVMISRVRPLHPGHIYESNIICLHFTCRHIVASVSCSSVL